MMKLFGQCLTEEMSQGESGTGRRVRVFGANFDEFIRNPVQEGSSSGTNGVQPHSVPPSLPPQPPPMAPPPIVVPPLPPQPPVTVPLAPPSPSANVSEVESSSSSESSNPEHKRSESWTREEHESFLRGLKEEGKGKWKEISEKYVSTRTKEQVASHAQKYFNHLQAAANGQKKKNSIFDVQLN